MILVLYIINYSSAPKVVLIKHIADDYTFDNSTNSRSLHNLV